MTLTDAEESVVRAPRRWRRWVVAALVAVLVALGGVGLAVSSPHRVDVQVLDADCGAGQRVVLDGGLRVDADPGMRCDVTLVVENRSRISQHVTDAAMFFGGRGGGARITMVPLGGDQPSASRGIDAHVPLDVWVRPGHRRELRVTLVDRPDQCGSAGTMRMPWPVLTVTSLGRHARVEGAADLRIHDDQTVPCPDQ